MMPGGLLHGRRKTFSGHLRQNADGRPAILKMARHFVKMVHNGIEYGDMQLTCEIYDLMKRSRPDQQKCRSLPIKQGRTRRYLIEITRTSKDGGHEVIHP